MSGACRIPEVGKPINQFYQRDLLWAENILTEEERKELTEPLWTKSDSGYGYGDGDGDGDG